MSKNDQQGYKQEVMKTYSLIYVVIAVMFLIVLGQVIYISTFGGEKYRKLGLKASHDSLIVEANRGNILDCNGNLLASTIPSYRLHMDMMADGLTRDTQRKYIDSLSICLSHLYQTASPYQFKRRIEVAFANPKKNRYFLVDSKRLSYTEYKQVMSFPLFRKGRTSGVAWEENITRQHPYGKLGARTIGNNYAEGSGYSGLEKAFNKELAGKPGVALKEKKGGRWIKVNAINPIDGYDIVSTLDIDMQDIAEDALEKNLKQSNAAWGCAVVMEVATGEIKAIANLQKGKDSSYVEAQNFAVSAMTEPGSTFKTASVMAALEDGVTDTSEVFDTGCGYWQEDDWTMTDHNVKYKGDNKTFSDEGGYHEIPLSKALWYSSNIGIAKMVDKYYRSNPRRFVDLLYDLRLKEPLDIVIPGAAFPKLADPSDPKWNRATLLWMSFGYNIQIPPIYTLAFYNAIANNGKMVSPQFVKSINENGRVVKEFGTKVVKSSICSEGTLKKVQSMLEGVVNYGTGNMFKSKTVSFAGKTGTAQTNYWSTKSGTTRKHQYSFCGYFPAKHPKYSCIVVVFQPTNRGISPAGLTFKEIAEHISAKNCQKIPIRMQPILAPHSLKGAKGALEAVYNQLDIPYTEDESAEKSSWANIQYIEDTYKANIKPLHVAQNCVPDVVGMGAKDAVYLLEHLGLKVRIRGYGEVIWQSEPPGSAFSKGKPIDLILRYK